MNKQTGMAGWKMREPEKMKEMDLDCLDRYKQWVENAADPEMTAELTAMTADTIREAFSRDLKFGTGGLRGILGAGTDRMNIYTVARASQGLADYINGHRTAGPCVPSVAVSYDSRMKSDVFAGTAAAVFAANGINVYVYSCLMPIPCLSFAVRKLGCAAGVVVTASHNPAEYNGYKVYGPDGCQITTDAAGEIQRAIGAVDIFEDVRWGDFAGSLADGSIRYIPDDVYTDYIEAVKGTSVLYGDDADEGLKVVYTPLNGTGLGPVLRTLRESGYDNITVVKEQEEPDGRFPTCPRPNPEEPEAMEIGIRYCRELGADLLLATDPDCDRLGIAVKDESGEYRLLSANETGLLLLDFICSQRKKHGTLGNAPVFIKTIVTTDLAERIAEHYGLRTVNTLIGFKYIGEQIGQLENKGDFIFGFEESYGYLSGTYVRDKDGVNAALLICDMATFYKARGISLLDRLEGIYRQFGYCRTFQRSYPFAGVDGIEKMAGIVDYFRNEASQVGGVRIEKKLDYLQGIDGLPRSNVLKLEMEDGNRIVIRPSGTEPKLKVYFTLFEDRQDSLKLQEECWTKEIKDVVYGFQRNIV